MPEKLAEKDTRAGLSQDQIDRFRREGYLRVGKLLEDDLTAILREGYDHEFGTARKNGRFRNLAIDNSEDLDSKNEADEQMLQIMQMCERNMAFRRLIYHEKILNLVESLLGPNIQLFHDQALYKPAFQGGTVFWHQDNAYWQCEPASLVSCWLTLDDVNEDNGSMHVIPGSHLQPLKHERSDKTDALLDFGDKVDESKAIAVNLPAGGVMFHHCQTLHFTPPNKTDRQRRAFAIHFMPPGTRSRRTGDYLSVSYSRPMLRMRM